MADDAQDLVQFLQARKAGGGLQSATTTGGTPTADTGLGAQAAQLTQLTRQALSNLPAALQNAAPFAITAQGNLSWFERNQRKDAAGAAVPIDIESGIDLGDFARIVWQRRPEERIAVLRKMFPNQTVRLADTGEPIVEVAGPGGVPKDVLVNPPGFNAADLMEIGTAVPQTIGGAIGMGLGAAGGTAIAGPIGGVVGRVAGAAAGAALTGMAQDVAARSAEGLPLDMREIEQARSKEAELNALFDVGLGAGAKTLRIFSPFAGQRGPLEFNLKKAVDYFKRVHGETFQTTPGEMAGSGPGAQLLRRIEATEAPQPGASSILGRIQSEGEAAINRIFNAAVGRRVPEEQLAGDLVQTAQRSITRPVEEAVATARNDLIKRGEDELVNIIDSFAPGRATRQEAGEAIRSEFLAKREAARANVAAAYDAVRRTPGGSGKTLSGDPVANAAAQIVKELPKAGSKVLPSGRPSALMTALKDMQSLRGKKMSLDELTRLKNAANDEIAKTEAVPGVKDRWFSMVAGAYDDAITKGVEAIGAARTYPGSPIRNTALADALTAARDTYKRELVPLEREGLHDILRTASESGFQAPEQLVSRLFSGARAEHNYRVLQETLGASSPAFSKIKSSLLSGWLEDAGDPLTGRINPAKLEEAFTALRGAHPEIYRDVIGGNEQQLFQVMRSLKAAGGEVRDLDQRELAQLLAAGNPTRPELERLATAQRTRDAALTNRALKSIAETNSLGTSATPVEFVNSLFNTSLPTADLQKVLSTLSPAQMEDLRTAALYRVLNKASGFQSQYAPLFLEGQHAGISGKGLANALGDPGSLERARNELLLGPNHLELVRQSISALSPREIKTGLFKAAGGMAATGIIEKLLKVPLQYATTWARKAIIAAAYTSEPAKRLLLNEVAGPKETAALANMLIASEPFLRKLHDTVGEDAAYSVIKDAKASIDKFVVQDTQPSQEEAQRGELLRFLETRKGKVKLQTTP